MNNLGVPSDMNLAVLGDYLTAEICGFGKIESIRKFPGGQSNPTFVVDTNTGPFVLRRKPSGELLESAHAVDREFRVMKALAHSDVPVPRMYHLCEDDSVVGSSFFVMEYIAGRHWWDQQLPRETNQLRSAVFDEQNRVLAALHTIDVDVAGLGDYGPGSGYFARQVKRWTGQYRASATGYIDDIEQLIAWLGNNIPDDDGKLVLVHGDYRLDNMIFHPDRVEIIALLDWELSTLGHPLADLAYQCMQWRLPPGRLSRGLAGVDRASIGIPSEEEYVERYWARRGISAVEGWTFALAFSFFRLAVIVQGVKKRAAIGNASSRQATELAKMVEPLVRMAVNLIEEE